MGLFRAHGRQVAALCWRPGHGGVEVLLITSLGSKRWILPKGWAENGMTLAEAAAREAYEEAGVRGEVAPQPVGRYHYLKEKKNGGGGVPCTAEVFPLRVTAELDDWPEKGARRMAWLPPEQAAVRVAEPGLRQVLRDFARGMAAPRRRAS